MSYCHDRQRCGVAPTTWLSGSHTLGDMPERVRAHGITNEEGPDRSGSSGSAICHTRAPDRAPYGVVRELR
jgi:hypothetical protein